MLRGEGEGFMDVVEMSNRTILEGILNLISTNVGAPPSAAGTDGERRDRLLIMCVSRCYAIKREEKEIETEEGKARKEIASTIDVEAEVVTEIWVGKESETEIMIIREGIWA
ncbi:hypothetical protein Tco_1093854 [Tanacetum coccineum]|uniref:Uncharacterized protein n=1 Tax=Tanacetum coccineum TaxID=301880 RepID=A0ABQ5IF46_9ASTR